MHKHFNTSLSSTENSAPLIKRMRDEHISASCHNHIIVTRYANGKYDMPMHDHPEDDMTEEADVWIKSFGATRTLKFTHKRSGQVVQLKMTDGSVFVMGPKTNANWKHEVLREPAVKQPRISAIFRHIHNLKKVQHIPKCSCKQCKNYRWPALYRFL